MSPLLSHMPVHHQLKPKNVIGKGTFEASNSLYWFDAARLLSYHLLTPLRAKRLTLRSLHAHEASNSAPLFIHCYLRSL